MVVITAPQEASGSTDVNFSEGDGEDNSRDSQAHLVNCQLHVAENQTHAESSKAQLDSSHPNVDNNNFYMEKDQSHVFNSHPHVDISSQSHVASTHSHDPIFPVKPLAGLRSSKSDDGGRAGGGGGSVANLCDLRQCGGLEVVNLSQAKSYQAATSSQDPSGGQLSPQRSPRQSLAVPHKVQFVENKNLWRNYSVETEEPDLENPPGASSPSRNVSWMGKSSSPGKRRANRNRKISEASSVSSVVSASSGTSYSYAAQDGGYGWVVVAASFFVNMIADGVGFSFGVMFDEFERDFDSSKAVTAGVVSVFHAIPLLTGPLATWLTDRYGCRRVTILGAILASAGFFTAAFSHHIVLLYLFFGVLAGFGLSLCYVAAIIIVAYYFDRKRSFATGVSVCGSGVGTFLFAPLTQYLLDQYGGWRGACIILAGIFLNMCICGMLFRELPWTKKMRVKRAESSRSLSNMPEIEELRLALEEGDVSVFLESEEEEPRLTSSLLTIPTYIKNPSLLPTEVLNLLATNRKTYDYILHNFPDSLIAKSISDYALEQESKEIIKSGPSPPRIEKKEESTGAKLARRVSSLLKGPKSILKKKPDVEPLPPIQHTKQRSKEEEEEYNRLQRLHQLRVRRQSLTYKGAFINSTRQGVRSSSCPDIRNPVIPDIPAEESCSYLQYLSFPFILFCISNSILYFWYDVPYVYTIEFVESRMAISSQESTHIISIIGILNTLGEVIVGWFGDRSWVSTPCLYALCMLCCGVTSALIPLCRSYPLVLGLSAVYGFCISANYSLTSPILVELVSLEKFSTAYGFLLAAQGVANLVGPVFAGWLYDFSKEWFLTFGLTGLFIGFSGVILVIHPFIKMVSKICKTTTKPNNQTSTGAKTTDQNVWSEKAPEVTINGCGNNAVLV